MQNKTRFIYLILTYLSLQVLLDDVGQVPGVGDPVELVGQMDGIQEECLQDSGDFILGVPEIKCFSCNLAKISTYLNFCCISGLNLLYTASLPSGVSMELALAMSSTAFGVALFPPNFLLSTPETINSLSKT